MQNFTTYFSSVGLQGLLALYFITNTFRLLSYVPQILQVYRQQDDVKAISLWTWGMWTASNFTTALYAGLVIEKLDLLLVLLNLGNALGCLSVILIVVAKRRKYGRKAITNAVQAPVVQYNDMSGERIVM